MLPVYEKPAKVGGTRPARGSDKQEQSRRELVGNYGFLELCFLILR